MILVIAEKPSVAQSIAKVLGATSRKDGYMEGGNYIVSWCFGHLVELADASSYDERYAKWRYDDLPIVPENWMFEVTKDKAQQFKVLSSLMKDKRVTELVCATDAGREGELIFRLVYDKAGCTKPFKRLWISSLEDSAIREGFNHLRDGKDYPFLSDAEAQRFGTGKEEIGKCPRCGSPVYVGKGNFYCSNKECSFCLWEDNKFFSGKKKKLTKKIAKELLDKGWCRVTGLYTPKKPQLYDAVIRLDDSGGKYVSFKMEFDR